MPWIGRKKIAFVPLSRPNALPPDPIPADWETQILRRVLYDPDPRTGRDRSLRAFIHTVSSGRADLDVVVTERHSIDRQDVAPDALEGELGARLRDEGCDAAAIVMLGGLGAGTNRGFWSRFVMVESVGTWAMELMHSLTGFTDLYPFGNDVDPQDPPMGSYDQMSGAEATHPSAYSKAGMQWIDRSTIAEHTGRARTYAVHALSLTQPPPTGRVAAIKIGSGVPYRMVEARLKADQFDAGIPAEGVIVYRVQTPDLLGFRVNHLRPLTLETTTALSVGQAFVNADDAIGISVVGSFPGGYLVKVDDRHASLSTGQLLFYRDDTRDGTGDVNSPFTIGMGGWQQFRQLFSGGEGIIYAVDPQGQLLFYRDRFRDGTGDVNSPAVIGQGGWQQMRFLFAGDSGVIYAVDSDGRLLFYRDHHRDGTGDVNSPSVIGQGGWQQFRKVFYGGDGIIYAVDQQGRLLFYRDHHRDGTGDVNTPSVIGQGGWQQMSHLFSGGDGIIYAVDQQGRLLFYRDRQRDGTGDVNTPSVIGQGGWQQMKFLFDGGGGIIYAVPK